MRPEVLEQALRRAGATILGEETHTSPAGSPITKADLMLWGLTGRPDSAQKRAWLLKELALPSHMTPNSLLPVLNALYSKETLQPLLEERFKTEV